MHPKKPVSTRNVVERYGRADNVMCKTNQTSQDFLLDLVKHCPGAVIAIKSNSIGARLFSSQAKKYCPSLTPDRTTKDNNEIVLGEKCLCSFMKSPQHASDETATELSAFGFMRNEGTMRCADPFRFKMTNSLLSSVQTQQPETVVTMETINRQEDVVHLTNDQGRIQEGESGQASPKTPFGASKSVVSAAKKAAGSTSRRVPLAPKIIITTPQGRGDPAGRGPPICPDAGAGGLDSVKQHRAKHLTSLHEPKQDEEGLLDKHYIQPPCRRYRGRRGLGFASGPRDVILQRGRREHAEIEAQDPSDNLNLSLPRRM